jgi:Uma2 family endonuclease
VNARTNIEHLKPPVSRYAFSVEEYHKLADAGVLHEDSRVELIEGELIKMPPIGPPHASNVETLAELLMLKLARRAIVRIQDPIWLNDHTEPEPDLVIAKLQPGRYRKSHPRPEDVLLIVEVADSTLEYDRKVKMPLYAEHGIAEAWLLDLTAKQLEIYLEPSNNGYRQCLKPPRDAVITPTPFPDVQVNLAELFADT